MESQDSTNSSKRRLSSGPRWVGGFNRSGLPSTLMAKSAADRRPRTPIAITSLRKKDIYGWKRTGRFASLNSSDFLAPPTRRSVVIRMTVLPASLVGGVKPHRSRSVVLRDNPAAYVLDSAGWARTSPLSAASKMRTARRTLHSANAIRAASSLIRLCGCGALRCRSSNFGLCRSCPVQTSLQILLVLKSHWLVL